VLDHLGEAALGVAEPAFGEGRVTNAKHQLWEKVVRREESLDSMTFLAGAINDKDGWRPLRAIPSAEPFELVRLFAGVYANRDEVLIDEFRDASVGIHLGIQPSTARSHRGGAEIEQHVALLGARVFERLFHIMVPRNRARLHGHWAPPLFVSLPPHQM
jgi:hypothetical protein